MSYMRSMLPKYQQLVLELRHQIASGQLAGGARPPTQEFKAPKQRGEGAGVSPHPDPSLPHRLPPPPPPADLPRQSVHDLLTSSAELPPVRAVIEIDAKCLSSADARLLDVAPATP